MTISRKTIELAIDALNDKWTDRLLDNISGEEYREAIFELEHYQKEVNDNCKSCCTCGDDIRAGGELERIIP